MKTDFILRSLSKTSHKRWEHYAITRIFHRLNDPEIEFVCQQCIRKKDGKISLTDLFFPQFGVYLEIDEPHHSSVEKQKEDAQRRFDIVDATGLMEHRISVAHGQLDKIDQQIEQFIDLVKSTKRSATNFEPWTFEGRYTAQPHLKKGILEMGPQGLFKTHRDALNCFGYTKGDFMKGVWDIPEAISQKLGLKGKTVVWFPTLHAELGQDKTARWNNILSPDGKQVTEISKVEGHSYVEKWDTRVIFAKTRDAIHGTLYRFVGVFEVDETYQMGSEHRFNRIATAVKVFNQVEPLGADTRARMD